MDTIKSLSYQFAGNRDAGRAIGRALLEQYPNFIDAIPNEVRAEFYSGCYLRYAENNPQAATFYVRDGDHYLPVKQDVWDKSKKEKVHVTVAFAVAETPQRFAQMRHDNPALHALIKPVRDNANKYASNTIGAMIGVCRGILNEGKPRERSATAAYSEVVKKAIDTLKTRCKTAHARGDDTADERRLIEAINAFLKVWKA